MLTKTRALVLASVAGVLVLGAVAALLVSGVLTNAPRAEASDCYGPRALVPGSGCNVSAGRPTPSAAVVDTERARYASCTGGWKDSPATLTTCLLGNTKVRRSIAVVGDSHGTAWLSGMNQLGLDAGWKIKPYVRSACTPSIADPIRAEATERRILCAKAMRNIMTVVAKDPDIKIVVVAASQTSKKYAAYPGRPMKNPNIDGFTMMWDRWRGAGKTVVVLTEVPRPGRDVPKCLLTATSPLKCAEPRSKAFTHGTLLTNAAKTQLGRPGFRYTLLRDYFCDASRCYAQIGGIIPFRDQSHISNSYSRAMSGIIASKLGTLLK